MSRQRPGQRRYIDPSSGAAAKKMHIFGWKNFLAVLLCLVLCAGGGALLIFYNTVNAVNYQPIEDQTDKDEILISDLLDKPCNIGKIFNLDRATCFYYLDQLQKAGRLEVIRTAGLDVVKLKQRANFYDAIQEYYRAINGVAE